MKKTFRTILMISTLAAAVGCGSTASNNEAAAEVEIIAKVSVSAATVQEVPQDAIYTSTVIASVVNNIAPQTGGRINKLYCEIGDFVKAGQVVAEMDQVSLLQAKLQMLNDSTELDRIHKLYEQGGVSKSDLESMELAYKVHKTSYENLLENTILRSPVSGVITARNYDKGDLYAGSPLYIVQQITPVHLLVAISESDYTRLRKGDKVEVSADALPGKTFTGKINRIYPTMDAGTHTFTIEVAVENSSRVLRPGMFARVKVSFGSNSSVVIPDAAVVKQNGSGQRQVFVKDGDKAVLTVVKLGRHFGNNYEILEGLSEGDIVVVKGNASLKNGDKIEVVE
jgi:RND family efflux transporter MFP subunit